MFLNVGPSAAAFCVQNALKLTNEHLRSANFFSGFYPLTPVIKGRDGRVREGERGGRGGIGSGPPQILKRGWFNG
jgi:hypothetical protein